MATRSSSDDDTGEANTDEADEADADEAHTDEPDTDEPEVDASARDDAVTYECSAWAGESRGLLGSLLNTKDIRHVWQGTTLTIHDSDEDEVDALIDEVLASARPALNPAPTR